jgi:GDP-D-mannose 3',5'-epimerase
VCFRGHSGGFIGGHLVAELRRRGHRRLRAVDIKPLDQWFQRFDDADNRVLDLRRKDACHLATGDARYVFNLASDFGGMGFIELNKALCMTTVLINTHMLMGARHAGVERFFFSSPACVYAADKQTSEAVCPTSRRGCLHSAAGRRLWVGEAV